MATEKMPCLCSSISLPALSSRVASKRCTLKDTRTHPERNGMSVVTLRGGGHPKIQPRHRQSHATSARDTIWVVASYVRRTPIGPSKWRWKSAFHSFTQKSCPRAEIDSKDCGAAFRGVYEAGGMQVVVKMPLKEGWRNVGGGIESRGARGSTVAMREEPRGQSGTLDKGGGSQT